MDLGSDYLKAVVAHQEELDRKVREQHQRLVEDLDQYLAQERKRLESINCNRGISTALSYSLHGSAVLAWARQSV